MIVTKISRLNVAQSIYALAVVSVDSVTCLYDYRIQRLPFMAINLQDCNCYKLTSDVYFVKKVCLNLTLIVGQIPPPGFPRARHNRVS